MTLPSFSRMNEIVSIQSARSNQLPSTEGLRASRSKTTATSTAPQTILLLSWSDASPRYIEKYTNFYTTIWPEAEIILVQSGMADFFYRTKSTSRRLLKPAIDVLSKTTDNSLLVHVMSNAGSKQWCTLNESYFQSTGRTLSSCTTIIDSAPGRARFSQSWAALAGSLPKAFIPRMTLGFVFGIFLCMMHLAKVILPGADQIETVRTQMNDVAETAKGARRCYIYSKEDKIIGWEDVEEHAKDAKEKGWTVELVKFSGSTHVGHFKQDPERYRETIEKTWFAKSG